MLAGRMGTIRVLPPDVANKIAAGEVVERPASIVKELVENSLDAQARSIRVEIEDGGRKLIRVTDDGAGIAAEDLPVLFQSHATSKIRTAEDLFRLTTLGFRGEALASIGAVAHVTLTTRRRGDLEGAQLVCSGGNVRGPNPTGSHEGTTVEVRNLFHTIPARRKFLKSAAVEYDHIREVLIRFGLCYPGVRFQLDRDGETDLVLMPTEETRGRIGQIFGKEFAADLLELDARDEAATLRAYLAPPKYARTTMQGQHVFLNGRAIRDRLIARALNEAYREVLVTGRYAVAILFLTVPPDKVDVNVHPSKAEVRFRESSRIFDLIVRSVRERLLKTVLTPSVRPEEFAPPAREPDIRETIAAFFGGASSPTEPPPLLAPEERPVVEVRRRCFQLHKKYIVEEVDDGILIIDQHALHERVMLERLKHQYASSNLCRQRMLIPGTLDVTEQEKDILAKNRRALESVGIEIEEFGRRTVRVTSVPAMLRDVPAERLVRDFLDLASEGGAGEVVQIEELLALVACKAAVKFGDELSPEQIEELLAQRHLLDNPHACAHGRPVSIKLSLDELERFFRRR